MLVSKDLKYFTIGEDYYGFYIQFRSGNINQRISEKIGITPQKFASLVRKHNGKNMRDSKRSSTHRFKELSDANKFGIELESIFIMNTLCDNCENKNNYFISNKLPNQFIKKFQDKVDWRLII